MFILNTLSHSYCFNWLKKKCKTNRVEQTSLYPTVAIEVRPNIQQPDITNVPTILAEVQELTFDKNGNPNIVVVKSSQSTSETNLSESSNENNYWTFESVHESHIEDLQRIDDVEIPNKQDINSESRVNETSIQDWKPSSHLYKYWLIMRFCGTAPLTRGCKPQDYNQRRWKWLCALQQVIFWIVVACSAFDLACQSKLCLLKFLSGEGFNALVNFAFCLISVATVIQFACLLCREQAMTRMRNVVRKYEGKDHYDLYMPNAAMTLGIITVVDALALQIFSFGMWDESFLETILYNSYTLGQNLLLWNYKNITTTNEQIFDQFYEPTASYIFLGITLMIRDFLSSLFIGMMWDLILIINLVLSCWKHVFIKKHALTVMKMSPESSDASTMQAARERVFNNWRDYKIVYQFVNTVFSPFLPLYHVYNVLLYAFFLSICILPDERSTAIVYVDYLYAIAKAEITYAISSRLTQQDEIIRKLLRNWGMRTGKITVDGEDWDLNALLDELDSEPMLFGTGSFAINQRFHFGIIGLVGSLFVSLANGIGKINSAY